jgi:hypothetical protein
MLRGKEISEDIGMRVVRAHQSGEGYKIISKRFELHQAFNMTAIRLRSGRPSKISPRATRTIVNQVKANPNITSRDLQTTLTASRVTVHASTIRTLN